LSLNESKWFDTDSNFKDVIKRKRTNKFREAYDTLEEELEALKEIDTDFLEIN
jgi:hypothetical protein